MPRLRQGRAPAPSPTVYKVISLLLQYPDERLLGARDEILAAVAGLLPSRQKESIERFCAYWAAGSPIELAQRYVEVFDLQKRAGLYLTFYGHGDKRQRGILGYGKISVVQSPAGRWISCGRAAPPSSLVKSTKNSGSRA